jgi:hypothetical protein
MTALAFEHPDKDSNEYKEEAADIWRTPEEYKDAKTTSLRRRRAWQRRSRQGPSASARRKFRCWRRTRNRSRSSSSSSRSSSRRIRRGRRNRRRWRELRGRYAGLFHIFL